MRPDPVCFQQWIVAAQQQIILVKRMTSIENTPLFGFYIQIVIVTINKMAFIIQTKFSNGSSWK